MQFRINIKKPLTIVDEMRVVLPTDKPCDANVQDGIVQVAHPHGPFALPLDRFYKYRDDGSITIEGDSLSDMTMNFHLSKNEKDQLLLIERGLRTNERLGHDRALIESLIRKGLLVPNGISIQLTTKGEDTLKAIKNPPLRL